MDRRKKVSWTISWCSIASSKNVTLSGNSYSSSDSESEDEIERKIHVEIKPLNNGTAPISASVDELRATVENLSLSPIGALSVNAYNFICFLFIESHHGSFFSCFKFVLLPHGKFVSFRKCDVGCVLMLLALLVFMGEGFSIIPWQLRSSIMNHMSFFSKGNVRNSRNHCGILWILKSKLWTEPQCRNIQNYPNDLQQECLWRMLHHPRLIVFRWHFNSSPSFLTSVF